MVSFLSGAPHPQLEVEHHQGEFGACAKGFSNCFYSPMEVAAERAGYTLLGSGTDAVGSYLGPVSVANRDWMRDDRASVIAFIRALQASMDWLYDIGNKEEAVTILSESVPAMSNPVAEAAYKIMVDRERGFYPDLAIPISGLETVLRLRSEYADAGRQLTDPSKYIDTSFYEAAKP